jgi:uncharacterized protein (DUF2062 family)
MHRTSMNNLSSKAISSQMVGILSQGMTPTKLAITIAVGFCIGCFPLLGVTTALCILVAFIFRMNQAAIQVGNYLAFPLQLLLTIPFLRLGEIIFHSAPLPLAPNRVLSMARTDPDQTARAFVAGQGHAIIAWALIAPIAALLITVLLIPLFRSLMRSSNISATRLNGTAS